MYWYESRARTNLGGPDSVPAGCAVLSCFFTNNMCVRVSSATEPYHYRYCTVSVISSAFTVSNIVIYIYISYFARKWLRFCVLYL